MSYKIDWTTITYSDSSSSRVGTWFDGSAVYRRTIHVDITATETEKAVQLGDSSSTGILWLEGTFARSNGSRLPINFQHATVSNIKCMVFAGNTNQINYWAPPGAVSLDFNVYYTKTS